MWAVVAVDWLLEPDFVQEPAVFAEGEAGWVSDSAELRHVLVPCHPGIHVRDLPGLSDFDHVLYYVLWGCFHLYPGPSGLYLSWYSAAVQPVVLGSRQAM